MLQVVDDETGEIVCSLAELIELNKKGKKSYDMTNRIKIEKVPDGELFSKLYHKIMSTLAKTSLTASEVMVFLYLATNIKYMSNVAKCDNGMFVNRDILRSELELSSRTIKASVHRLIKEGLVIEVITQEGRAFIVNPFVVSIGNKINKTIYDLFRKSKWARW